MNLGYHSSSASGNYLGRIEPIKGKSILDELADYDLDLTVLKNTVEKYFNVIKRDLDFLEDKNDWMIKSRVKPKKGRKV